MVEDLLLSTLALMLAMEIHKIRSVVLVLVPQVELAQRDLIQLVAALDNPRCSDQVVDVE